jgi:hypothetical protein
MKKIFYILFALVVSAAFTSCYSDKGNYDYTDLDSLSIEIPYTTYNAALGGKLQISPTVTTVIDNSDLSYYWEVLCNYRVTGSYDKFLPFAKGKDLDYTIALNDTMPTMQTYTMRLHVVQNSLQRDFYSSTFTVTFVGHTTGLIVLHGNDTQSDIGLVRANEFMATSSSTVDEVTVQPYFWSAVNGSKIPGKGKQIIQTISSYMNWASAGFNGATGTACADVVAITNQAGVFGNYASLKKEGNWDDGFYGHLNHGKPQNIKINGQYVYAVDDGVIFRKDYSVYTFVSPLIEENLGYTFGSPIYEPDYTKLAQGIFFDSKKRAFIGIPYITYTPFSFYTMTTDASVCNLGDIKADLVYMDKGGLSGHYLCLMKDDSGSKFLVELDPAGGANHQMANMAYAKYDMSTLTDFANAETYAFGDNEVNMCYYSTPTGVYQFSVIKGNALSAQKLRYSDGSTVDFGGQTITMVKVLKPSVTSSPKFNYFNYNKILLVGTYGGSAGTGKLYSMTVDELSGLVVSKNVYEGFDKIYDANIKAF